MKFFKKICLQFFLKWYFYYICLYYSITLHKICRFAKVKKQPFRGVPSQILFKNFAKIFKLLFLTFSKFRRSCFQKTSLSDCFQSYYYSFFVFFHFYTSCSFHESYFRTLFFIIRSLHSVVSFYVYVYDGWTGSISLICNTL